MDQTMKTIIICQNEIITFKMNELVAANGQFTIENNAIEIEPRSQDNEIEALVSLGVIDAWTEAEADWF